MNRDTLDRWCEVGILLLVLAVLVFGPLAMGAVRSLEFLIVQGLTVGVVLLWITRLWINPKPKLLWPPICWAIIAFSVYAVVRYLTSDVEYIARAELIRVLVYACLFFSVLNNLHRQESIRIIGLTVIFLAMAISSYAIYQFLTGSDRIWHFTTPYKGRGCGTYICPNHLAGFIEMLLPLALAYTLVGRIRPLQRIVLGYAALVMAAGLGTTVSRAGWVSCGIALLFLFGVLAMHRGHRLHAVLLLSVLMAGGIFFTVKAEPLKKRFAEPSAPDLTELDLRYKLWDAAVRMWRDNFWFGVGPGHYNTRFPAYRPFRVQMQPDRVHNDFLNVLADWGIVGAALVVAGMGALVVGGLKTWKAVRQSENQLGSGLSNRFAFVLGATAGLLALVLHSIFDFNMHIPANAILAFVLAALLTGHWRFVTDRFWIGARPLMKSLLIITLFFWALYLCWQEVRLGGEYFWLNRASRASTFSPEQVVLLERAFRTEPNDFATCYAIGESFRVRSFEGGDSYRELAQKAMDWYARSMKLNPYDAYNYMRYGMCLDWLDRHDEAASYFGQANDLDPNGSYVAAHIGWHYVQTDDYAAARTWYLRSKVLQLNNNDMADSYLEIVRRKLLQRASNQLSPLAR